MSATGAEKGADWPTVVKLTQLRTSVEQCSELRGSVPWPHVFARKLGPGEMSDGRVGETRGAPASLSVGSCVVLEQWAGPAGPGLGSTL